MIDTKQFVHFVVTPALLELDMYSLSAVQILLCTAAVESDMGTYLRQFTKDGYGPGRGIYGHENRTINDLIVCAASTKGGKLKEVMKEQKLINHYNPTCAEEMDIERDIYLATKLCRLQYYRFPRELPYHQDKEGMWEYYKKYWNTQLGATEYETFMEKCNKYKVWEWLEI